MNAAEKFESWGLVELFGHQRVAGKITEQSVGGCNFVRVDIPQADGTFYTRLFGQGAIYAINVTDEAAARVLATQYASKPPYAYELERAALQKLPAPQRPSTVYSSDDDDDEHDDYGDDDTDRDCPL